MCNADSHMQLLPNLLPGASCTFLNAQKSVAYCQIYLQAKCQS